MKKEQATRCMKVLRLKENRCHWVERVVVLDAKLSIYLNENKITTIYCMPKDEEVIAVGYLWSEGYISSRKDIVGVKILEEEYAVRVIVDYRYSGSPTRKRIFSNESKDFSQDHTESYTINSRKVKTDRHARLGISGDDIIGILCQFIDMSQLYKRTRAVHSAALYSGRDMLFFYEDIGRYNVIDKVMGRCIMDNLPTDDKILVISGRITTEIIQKVCRMDISIILSKAIATEGAIRKAQQAGISLIGCLQDNSVIIYSNPFNNF